MYKDAVNFANIVKLTNWLIVSMHSREIERSISSNTEGSRYRWRICEVSV